MPANDDPVMNEVFRNRVSKNVVFSILAKNDNHSQLIQKLSANTGLLISGRSGSSFSARRTLFSRRNLLSEYGSNGADSSSCTVTSVLLYRSNRGRPKWYVSVSGVYIRILCLLHPKACNQTLL